MLSPGFLINFLEHIYIYIYKCHIHKSHFWCYPSVFPLGISHEARFPGRRAPHLVVAGLPGGATALGVRGALRWLHLRHQGHGTWATGPPVVDVGWLM